MNRFPALLIVVGVIAGLFALEQQQSTPSAPASTPTELSEGPRSSTAEATGSTWYCPAGFTTPDGLNDHIVIITNPTDEPAVGTITIFPSLLDTDGNRITPEGEPWERNQIVEVAAGEQSEISLAPLVALIDPELATNTGAFVAALAEFERSGVSVEHRVVASQGSDVGACATSAATRWWFGSGTTTANVGYQLYLLNPFPDDAVVDISFVTDDGSRSPGVFSGKLVPANGLTVLQVAPEVATNAQVTADVTVRTGRVIAERIQIFDNADGPVGLSLSLGSNRLGEQWFFPAGRSVPGAGESYVVYNPGDSEAEVEFELKPDSADRAGDVAPLPIPVGPRERWIVTVSTHPTHPIDSLAVIDASSMVDPGEPFFVSVRSFNGVPIVVERIVTRPLEDGGVTASLGVDVASTDQLVMVPPEAVRSGEAEPEAAQLAILNPAGNTISRLQILIGSEGQEQVVEEVELAPRRRAVFNLKTMLGPDDQWIRIRSTTGVMAELSVTAGRAVIGSTAIPQQGTTSTPDLLTFE